MTARPKVPAGPKINLRETEVSVEVRDFLRRLGWKVYTLSDRRTTATRTSLGVPDLWAMHPSGRPPFWIEVKSETGKPSPEQVEFAALCHHAGTGYVIGGLAQVQEYLKKIGVMA